MKEQIESLRNYYKGELQIVNALIRCTDDTSMNIQERTNWNYYTGKQKVIIELIGKLDLILDNNV